MAKLSSIKLNEASVEEGVWVPWRLGMEFRIARFGNEKFRTFLRSNSRGAQFAAKKGVKPDFSDKDVVVAVAESILMDWRSVEDDDGNAIEYTIEKGIEILSDPAYSEIFEFIVEASRDYQLFRDEEVVAAEGN